MDRYNLITILGPTASGKTSVATRLAFDIGGEVISGDSRQVYRKMDIGTGKDIGEYVVDGNAVPYHLIDICDPGYKYNVFEFQRDFYRCFEDVGNRGLIPVLCGGSGLYVESVIRDYQMSEAPANKELRDSLEEKTLDELVNILNSYNPNLHNSTDTQNKRRTIRAIEIADYQKNNPDLQEIHPAIKSLNIGIAIDRDLRREKISRRLRSRLDEGMVEEIKSIIDSGVSPEDLIYYGLEYKYVTQYVIGEIDYDAMISQLEIAIHQFAKRQMTWFRGMERRGVKINWIDAQLPIEQKIEKIKSLWNEQNLE